MWTWRPWRSSSGVRADADRHAPLVVTLGAFAALSLCIVALVDFGDPIQAARARVERDARTHGAALEIQWTKHLARVDLPAPAHGLVVDVIDGATFDAPGTPADIEHKRLFDVLMNAGLAEASAGRYEQAIELVRKALAREAAPSQRALGHLHMARWASALGLADDVRGEREALAAEGLANVPVSGTAAGLLAALVEPIDAATALEILEGPVPALPIPRDVARLTPSGELVIEPDPWWRAVEQRLEPHVGEDRLDAAFRGRKRASEAVRALLGDRGRASPERWTLVGAAGADAIVALRQSDAAMTVASIRRDDLRAAAREVFAAQGADFGSPARRFDLRFAQGGPVAEASTATASPAVFDEGSLEGPELDFRLHLEDPLREGRAEARRMMIVRMSLFALAAAIMAATLLGARSMRRARRLATLRSTFVASVSHDLRTPIQSVLLMAETLERGRVATDQGKARYFASIRQEALRLRRFVEDLLDGARIDRGSGPKVEREWVSSDDFFDALQTAMRERTERDGAALTMTQTAMPKQLFIDAMSIERALWNLLENALRYGRSSDGRCQVTVSASMQDTALVFVIEDEGKGIPARFSESVFDPFERQTTDASGTGIEKSSGTGLGLAIVRAISRAHGGETRLDTTKTRGARFIASFRVVPPDQPTTDPEPPSQEDNAA